MISVIVPVYKIEEYLRQCLESLSAQTLEDMEIIIVDDGSPDGCPEICDEYAAKDARMKVVHKQNGGLLSIYSAQERRELRPRAATISALSTAMIGSSLKHL